MNEQVDYSPASTRLQQEIVMSNIRSFDGITPKLGESVWVDPTAVVIGDVEIGDRSSIWPLTAIRGDVNRIRIGSRTNIQDGSVLHVTHANPASPNGHPLIIGSDVTAGHKVLLHGCTIGDRCLIGMGSIVMDGAELASDIILAAGSLVTEGKKLEGGYLWCGSPAKRLRKLSDEELAFLVYVPGHYVKLAEKYRTD
jgi:carbonic anhydrase/acetyltransferase-like protein (isoleucine patch superfamily)